MKTFSKPKVYLFPEAGFKKIVVFPHLGILFLKLTKTGSKISSTKTVLILHRDYLTRTKK